MKQITQDEKYLKVKGHSDLVRDTESNAILSTDLKKLHEHRKKKEALKRILAHSKQDNKRIENLENDVSEIKELLIKLIEKTNK